MLKSGLTPQDSSVRIQNYDALASPDAASRKGMIRFHPRYQTWLQRAGLLTAEDVLSLPGEIVSGHPDRHVLRVELNTGIRNRVVYLKKEHRVPQSIRRANRRAGFGSVSLSAREAFTLEQLERDRIPAPQWLAYGEDDYGQAFLLLDDLSGYVDFRVYLRDTALSSAERRTLAHQLGQHLAQIHSAGWSTPDLCAKHVLIHPESGAFALLDWQRSQRHVLPSDRQHREALARLHATLSQSLVSSRERLLLVQAYRKSLKGALATPPAEAIAEIERTAEQLSKKSSIMLQRSGPNADPVRLVWLAGEAVVVVPELVPDWPQPAVAAPYYSDEDQGKPEERNWLTLPCQRQAILTTTQQKRSLLDTLMRRRHTSRCVVAARALAVWQQYQIPVPRLLAFGQRETRSRLDAFLLVDPIPGALRLEDTNLSADQRRALVKSAGRLLSDLHRLRYRIHDSTTADPAFVWTDSGLAIGSPFAWRKTRTRRRVVADLNDMVSILSITTQRELLRFLKAYDPVRAREYFKKCRNSLT